MADLFDLATARARRDAGLKLVAEHNPHFVHLMREQALLIAERNGTVTSDDLREYANLHGIMPKHPNAWGSIFRGKHWRCVGRTKSRLTSNHRREIKVWGLQ